MNEFAVFFPLFNLIAKGMHKNRRVLVAASSVPSMARVPTQHWLDRLKADLNQVEKRQEFRVQITEIYVEVG